MIYCETLERVGADRFKHLLAETIAIALGHKHITPQQLSKITVDTTVQEKAIAFPTDAGCTPRCCCGW